jgi:CRP-like cAMP-binding protein
MFGEDGMFEDKHRSATVVASKDSEILSLNKDNIPLLKVVFL